MKERQRLRERERDIIRLEGEQTTLSEYGAIEKKIKSTKPLLKRVSPYLFSGTLVTKMFLKHWQIERAKKTLLNSSSNTKRNRKINKFITNVPNCVHSISCCSNENE